MALDEHERLALVPDVIAGGNDVGAGIEQLDQDRSEMPKPPAAFSPLTTTKSRQ